MADLKSILGDAYKEGMTVEEINKALEGVNLYEGYVKKDVFDKTASEVAEWKKKHNALLSEEERKEAERLEAQKQLEEKLASLEREKALSEHKAKFLGLGYDEALATETAEALVNGDTEKLFANQSKFIESRDKALKAQLLNDTPTPGAGSGSGEIDYNKLINEAREAGDMKRSSLLYEVISSSIGGMKYVRYFCNQFWSIELLKECYLTRETSQHRFPQ